MRFWKKGRVQLEFGLCRDMWVEVSKRQTEN